MRWASAVDLRYFISLKPLLRAILCVLCGLYFGKSVFCNIHEPLSKHHFEHPASAVNQYIHAAMRLMENYYNLGRRGMRCSFIVNNLRVFCFCNTKCFNYNLFSVSADAVARNFPTGSDYL